MIPPFGGISRDVQATSADIVALRERYDAIVSVPDACIVAITAIDALEVTMVRAERVEAERDVVLVMLRRHEWDQNGHCYECGSIDNYGEHYDNCAWQQAMKTEGAVVESRRTAG